MYREVNQRKFSKATSVRLGSVLLLVVFTAPHLTAVAEDMTYSKLWGRNGELWSPTNRLPDFSYAGYSRGEDSLRELKADVSVKQFGAIGDGETDDTHAFKKAIDQSPGNVAASGRGVDICFDHHCHAPHANLFTDIDLGEGSRMFQSGGGAALGRHSASWETFWCIRAQRPQKWPDGWGPDMMNFVAVQPGQESVTDAGGRWFEAIEPASLHPRNLYESQIRRRLQSRIFSQRNH